MTLIEGLLTFAVMLVLSWLTEFILRKKFKIARRKGWLYHRVNNVHKRAERILFIGYMLIYAIFLLADYRYANYMIWGFFFFLFGIRAYMEWKYDRESKEFIITTHSLCWYLLFSAIIVPQLLEK
jgi:Domain of unknown function (DUF4181)